MQAPSKPFDDYKWIWASYAPTESLNDPAVFFGVLRAMRECEGMRKSSQEFYRALQRVEEDLGGRVRTVRLARSTARNLIRNSGQYWQATDVLVRRQGIIELSDFGRRVADGEIARREYGRQVVESFCLPNRRIAGNWSAWDDAELVIRPLKLILSILAQLRRRGDADNRLSVDELTRIVIPLAGSNESVDTHCEAIRMCRVGELDLSHWPNCVPEANDRRMAREFLLFLEHHGFVESVQSVQDEFALVDYDHGLDLGGTAHLGSADAVDLFATRPLQLMERPVRTGQRRFRRQILQAHGTQCILTGERMEEVLEAAHIVPVKYHGSDDVSNGLCLRSDVHTLFDSGDIRITESGQICLSAAATNSRSYSELPGQVEIPALIEPALEWRWRYY